MGYFKAVRSGGEISMRIADLLETAAPKEYTGANRVKTILECNDVLQGRADNISIGMLEEFLEQKCGACYPERVAELKQEMEDFFIKKCCVLGVTQQLASRRMIMRCTILSLSVH